MHFDEKQRFPIGFTKHMTIVAKAELCVGQCLKEMGKSPRRLWGVSQRSDQQMTADEQTLVFEQLRRIDSAGNPLQTTSPRAIQVRELL